MIRYNGEFCNLLATLSEPRAFAIATALLELGPSSPDQLAAHLKQRRVSLRKPLQSLAECGYVIVRRGRPVRYGINRKVVVPLLKLLENHLKRERKAMRG